MKTTADLIDFSSLFDSIKVYEMLMGLELGGIRHDDASVCIDWTYPDGSWAGTTSCDLPVESVIAKLDRLGTQH